MSKAAIITPSYINAKQRYLWAKESFDNIYEILGDEYPYFVVDSIPTLKYTFNLVPDFRYASKPHEIYEKSGVRLIRQKYAQGNRLATLQAVQEAKKIGADLIFIHLDDNVYTPELRQLLSCAVDAFSRDRELLKIEFVGYPLLWQGCSPEKGNLSNLTIEEDRVKFENVTLTPTRFENYTLWWSYFHSNMNGDFWPITLWSTIYRADFLEKILSNPESTKQKHLVNVELYYRINDNWRELIQDFPGKVGYINMQFIGIEKQNNKNWEFLITYPNSSVR
jgi:hypothetical protein